MEVDSPSFGGTDNGGRALTVVQNQRKPSASNIEGYFSYQAERKRKENRRIQQD